MRIALMLLSAIVLFTFNCKKVEPDNFVRPTTVELNNRSTGLLPIVQSMAAGDSVTVVCYGNSITFGGVDTPYPAKLQEQWRAMYSNDNIVVHNEGQPGWTAQMAANALDSLVRSHHPDMVTIMFGINDLAQGLSLENYEANLFYMIRRFQDHGIKVIVLSPTPLAMELNEPLLEFCRKAAIVANNNNVAFMNMHAAMVDRFDSTLTDAELRTLMPDLIHYDQAGYLLIADRLMQWWQSIE